MRRAVLPLLIFAAACAAQSNPFTKPAADVDGALRARITEFYDYHVKGEFRKADALVADDTKDYFFESHKPKYLSYEINRIDYFDNFTRAKAVVMCEMYIMMPGFNDKPVKMPTPSNWKLQDGKWFWFVDPVELRKTPFGTMNPGPTPGKGQPGPGPSLAALDMSVDRVLDQVKVDKSEVSMWAGDPAEVSVANTAPGLMKLSILRSPDGVDAKLAKSSLQANEKTTLKITTTPEARSGNIVIQIDPTGQRLAIQVKLK